MEEAGESKPSKSPSNDNVASGMQTPEIQPSVVPGSSQQPSILHLGGLPSYLILAAGQPVTTLRGAGLNVVPLGNNLSILQTNGLRLPVIQPEGLQSLTGQSPRAKLTTSQTRSLQPQIFQLRGLQPSTVQIGSSVGLKPQSYQLGGLQTQSSRLQSSTVQRGSSNQSIGLQTNSSFGLQPSTVHIGSTGQSIQLQPQTFQPAKYQTQSMISSEVPSHGLLPVSYELTTQTSSVKQVNRQTQDARKKAAKSKSELVTYVDVACSAYSVPKVKHTATNTAKVNKSVGTQANISLRSRSQAVQCPEGGKSSLRTPQTPQVEPTGWSSAAGGQDGDPSLQRNVMFAQDAGPLGNVLPAYEAWQADRLFLQDFQRIQTHGYLLCEPVRGC
ncbi:hypothetical protein GDO78_022868 [Eleutherodactylus coqui]|uniref:Uncharacterized protein n=1 Tax=Eleutherodactylus coqui TaxID=57060 RepID=A0A8J6BGJ8_ELECQ|nr:hypothetical protein GDO78_022868 [Eleutherodactylus coqui]